jgi:hypothetical protein
VSKLLNINIYVSLSQINVVIQCSKNFAELNIVGKFYALHLINSGVGIFLAKKCREFFFPVAQQPIVGQGLLIIEASR